MSWNLADLQWNSLLNLTLEIALIAGLILLLFRLRSSFGLGLLYVFVGSNQYLQTVLASALYLDLGGGVTVSLGSVVIFSSTLFAILLTYLQEDIPKTRVLIYGVIFSNLTLTALAWLTNHQIRSLPTRNLLSVPQELFSINPRAFLFGTVALILDAFLIVIVYEILLAKAKRMPLAVRLITTLLLVLYFDALIFTTGAFFGTARFGAVLVNQLIGKTLAGVLYGLILYLYIKLTGVGRSPLQPTGTETGVLSILTYRERYQIVKQQLESSEAANMAKNRFLAHMSHELRTPLNAVIGFTNVLRKNKASNLNAKDLLYLERIFGNAKHLLDLINGILDLSKIESGRSELVIDKFELNSLISETVDELRGQAIERNLELETELTDFPVKCESDRSALKQVLINLIGNALKFTDEGRVMVRLIAQPGSRKARSIEVSDTGVGIATTDLQSIFEAFKQAGSAIERRQGGTGLGLAISRALCELMGYGLEVESDHGRGSTFRIVMG